MIQKKVVIEDACENKKNPFTTAQMSYGGQKRTVICPCGWTAKSGVRDANAAMKLHKKVCEQAREAMPTNAAPAFNQVADVNGFNGMGHSRRGNPVHRPLRPSVMMVDGVPTETDMTVNELVEIQELLREMDSLVTGAVVHAPTTMKQAMDLLNRVKKAETKVKAAAESDAAKP